jgi:hypothetical protein
MDLAQHFAFTFYLQIMKKGGEPTSGLEPLTCSSYEFACVRSSLYWCVRKLRIFGWFSVLLTRLFVHRVLACTSQVAVNPWEKTLIAYPCSSRVIIHVLQRSCLRPSAILTLQSIGPPEEEAPYLRLPKSEDPLQL